VSGGEWWRWLCRLRQAACVGSGQGLTPALGALQVVLGVESGGTACFLEVNARLWGAPGEWRPWGAWQRRRQQQWQRQWQQQWQEPDSGRRSVREEGVRRRG